MENNGLRYGIVSSEASKAEVGGKQFIAPRNEIVDAIIAIMEDNDSLNPNEGKESVNITLGKDDDIDLIDLRGLPYDDPLWDRVLDQITNAELSKLIDECGYCSP